MSIKFDHFCLIMNRSFLKLVFFICLLALYYSGTAQILTGINSRWSDELTEWNVYTEFEDEEGELIMTWQQQLDWTAWDYRIEEASGSIKMKWRDDPNEWEIRGDNEIISARTKWKGDPREWRITNNDITLQFRSRWGNNFNEWMVTNDEYGYFTIYMDFKNDPRAWVIVDELSDDISLPIKMALVFTAVFNSIPKY